MKKFLAFLLAALTIISMAACGAKAADVPFKVGEDKTEYTVDGASGWTKQNVNIKIVAGDKVLYNGKVTLTSDNQFVSEITYAAVSEAGIGQDGVLSGFVNSIGDYAGGTDASGNTTYWGYTVNGKYVPLACNQMRVLEGDYILWEFQTYTGEVSANTDVATGIEAPYKVGSDTTEYKVDGASGWTEETVNIKIVAGEDVIYNGTVKLTSDNILVSEVTYAAITEAGVGQDGVLSGFVNSIGQYASGTNAEGKYVYWGYTVNGKYVPFACNQMPVLDGDYILWEFQVYEDTSK